MAARCCRVPYPSQRILKALFGLEIRGPLLYYWIYKTKRGSMKNTMAMDVIDFHTHYVKKEMLLSLIHI